MPRAAALCAGLHAFLAAGTAGAYCRSAACMDGVEHTGAVCVPAQQGDCGTPLAWATPCVEYSVQKDASMKVTFSEAEQVLKTAFDTWMNAACAGGGAPRILVTEGPPAVCQRAEYNLMGANANVVVLHDAWPYEGTTPTIALTTVTYTLDTGAILDADMELNTGDYDFTVGSTNVGVDLLTVVTHEAGHFLGLANSHDPGAVMSSGYMTGPAAQGQISPDDVAGVCAAYPHGAPICACNPTPPRGFSPQCGAQQPPGSGADLMPLCQDGGAGAAGGSGCSVSFDREISFGAVAAALAALLLATPWRRRSRA